jgi:hypothetical protein
MNRLYFQSLYRLETDVENLIQSVETCAGMLDLTFYYSLKAKIVCTRSGDENNHFP